MTSTHASIQPGPASASAAPRPIFFYYQGGIREIGQGAPTRTILQYLRENLHRTGTKEGCAEGDCGACTVVIGELAGDDLRLRAVNSCIQFLPSLDGKALFTIEDLAALTPEGLHPIQQAMVDLNGSQCGFCTPGFVMSLWAMYENHPSCPDRETVADTLSGNLCRCTGYRPILDAAAASYRLPRTTLDREPVLQSLRQLAALPPLQYEAGGNTCFAPRDMGALASLVAARPFARIVAGSTDVGLWVTKQLRELEDIILTGAVAELKLIRRESDYLEIGAGAVLVDAFAAIAAEWPEWEELARRFASIPIRNAGTLGGNVANGSPIGDSMPALIALGASVRLRHNDRTREMPLEDFYLDYQRTALTPGEFVLSLRLPRRPSGTFLFRTYKISKRFAQDISAVCGAFALQLDERGTIAEARVAFGGMAATPRRAPLCEAALTGQPWNATTAETAADALAGDYAPLTDMRASKHYRQAVAANLIRRLWLDTDPTASAGPVRLASVLPVA